MKSKVFSAALVICTLLRCTNPSTAGGSGTETVNTYASLPCGAPATGAVVRVIDAGGWIDSVRRQTSPVLESTIVATNGSFTLSTAASRMINLQIDNGASGRILQLVSAKELAGDTLILGPTHTFRAQVNNSVSQEVTYRLSGTTYKSDSIPGSISITGIPSAVYTLVAAGKPTDWYPVILKGLDLTISAQPPHASIQLAYDNLLVDDFETGIGPSTMSNLFPGISWYTYSDWKAREWDETVREWVPISDTSQGNSRSWVEIDSVDDGLGGKAAFFKAFLDHSFEFPWAGAGIFLNSRKGGIDLSMMESFSLRAKGAGTLTVRLETAAYDSINSGHSQFSTVIYLTPDWQTYTIPVQDLRLILPLESEQHFVSWETASRAVSKMEFDFAAQDNQADTLELYIDDLYLNGVTAGSFMK